MGFASQGPLQFPSANPMDLTAGRVKFTSCRSQPDLLIRGVWRFARWTIAGCRTGRSDSRDPEWRADPQPVWTAPGITPASTDLLHGMDVHPKFAENHLVYFSYPKAGPRGYTLAVARGKLEGATLTDVSDVFVADAWETSPGTAIAGRIMFGPDNTLYVAVGDRDLLFGSNDNSSRMRAQALDTHIGKVLRIRDDGGVPSDNPFVGKAGVKPEIFTYGHRNTYGFAFHPMTGELWQAEIGPMGGDEVNILSPGKNYGWPLVSMGRNYRARSCPINRGQDPEWRTRDCSGFPRSVHRASCSTPETNSRPGKAVCSSAHSTDSNSCA
jgi:hypothetical protein